MFERLLIIDAKDHLMGRLAAFVAKNLLCGQEVVIVRCEQINISGPIWRNRGKYSDFIRKRTATNPKRGPLHFHSPSKMFWRVVRGMLPHKTARGQAALLRLKTFEGCPEPYGQARHGLVVIPECIRSVALKKHRKYTVLGRLMNDFGWKYEKVIQDMEAKRKEDGAIYWQKKMEKQELESKIKEQVITKLDSGLQNVLAEYGY